VNYIERAEDLLPPDLYWCYLALADYSGQFSEPTQDEGWWYIRDWFISDKYAEKRASTPDFPCMSCMTINYRAKGGPARPVTPRPRPGDRKMAPDWVRYFQELRAIHMIQKKAVALYGAASHGRRKFAKQSRQRRQALRQFRDAARQDYLERKAVEKCVRGGCLTLRDRQLIAAYKQRMKEQHETNIGHRSG
jgi:hypothetical protein